MRLGMVTRGICINNEAACGLMSVWSPSILMTPDSMVRVSRARAGSLSA